MGVLLTDGMNNRGSVQPLDAATIAKDMQIKVYTVGIGSDGFVPFPTPTGGVQRVQVGLDENVLKEISEITGAIYRKATDAEKLAQIYDEINELEKTEVKARIYSYPEEREYFFWFLVAALIALALEHLLNWTRIGTLP